MSRWRVTYRPLYVEAEDANDAIERIALEVLRRGSNPEVPDDV